MDAFWKLQLGVNLEEARGSAVLFWLMELLYNNYIIKMYVCVFLKKRNYYYIL